MFLLLLVAILIIAILLLASKYKNDASIERTILIVLISIISLLLIGFGVCVAIVTYKT